MLMTFFKTFFSFFELIHLIVQVHKQLYFMVRDKFFPKIPSNRKIRTQNVVVTGGANGLGKQLCLQLAEMGAIVFIFDIDDNAANDLVNDIRSKNVLGNAFFLHTDVTDLRQVQRSFEHIHSMGRHVGILIQNAGVLNCDSLIDLTPEAIERTLKVNLMAHFWTLKCALPKMIEKKQGHIVAIASNFGLLGRSCFTDYAATKFGIVGLMDSLEDEFRYLHYDHFLQVTTICPAAIDTGLSNIIPTRFPSLLPVMRPEYAAQKIIEAIALERRFIIIPFGFDVLYTILTRLPRCLRHPIIDYIGSTAQANRNRKVSENDQLRPVRREFVNHL